MGTHATSLSLSLCLSHTFLYFSLSLSFLKCLSLVMFSVSLFSVSSSTSPNLSRLFPGPKQLQFPCPLQGVKCPSPTFCPCLKHLLAPTSSPTLSHSKLSPRHVNGVTLMEHTPVCAAVAVAVTPLPRLASHPAMPRSRSAACRANGSVPQPISHAHFHLADFGEGVTLGSAPSCDHCAL